MAKQQPKKKRTFIKNLRKKHVRSRSTKKNVKPKKKGTVKGSSKGSKAVGSKQKAGGKKPAKSTTPKKKPGPKKGSSKGSTPKGKVNDGIKYYNRLKSEVAKFYKAQTSKETVNRWYLEGKTTLAYTHLKSGAPPGGINDTYFKFFVNNLDQFLAKPTRDAFDKTKLKDTADGFNYWLIEDYFYTNEEDLRMFNKIVIDMEDLLGANEQWEATDPQDFDFVQIRRSVANLVGRMKRKGKGLEKYYAYFHIYRDVENNEIIFVLTDVEPDTMVDEDDMETPEVFEPAEEKPAEPEPKKKKKKGKEKKGKEKPAAAKPEPEEKLTAKEKATIAREEKRGSLDLLTAKRESFEKSMSFNNKQIREIADVIKILKDIGVNYADEKKQVLQLQAANKQLMTNIATINQKINDL